MVATFSHSHTLLIFGGGYSNKGAAHMDHTAEADWSLKYALGTGISGIQEQYFPLKYSTVFLYFFSIPMSELLLNLLDWQIFRSTVLWPLLIGIFLPLKLCVGCGFSSMVILVNNSVPNVLLGSVNGLALTASSISR